MQLLRRVYKKLPVVWRIYVKRIYWFIRKPSWLRSSGSNRRRKTISTHGSYGAGNSGTVSVVLPVYNHADLVPLAVRSILAQTESELELILVDDGSTDGLHDMLREVLCQRERDGLNVLVLEQRHQGLPHALTNGFYWAKGEYLCWTSADNVLEPEGLAVLKGVLLKAPEVSMVYGDYDILDEWGRPCVGSDFRPQDQERPGSPIMRVPRATKQLNRVNNNFIGPYFMYRAFLERLIGPYDLAAMGIEDYDYWMRINSFFIIKHIENTNIYYHYRVHSNSLTARAREEGIFERAERLQAYERRRQGFYDQPLILHSDLPATHELLDATERLDGFVIRWMLSPVDEANVLEQLRSCQEGEKHLFVLSAPLYRKLSSRGLDFNAVQGSFVVLYLNGDGSLYYDLDGSAMNRVDLVLTETPTEAGRWPRVLLIEDVRQGLRLAAVAANTRLFYKGTRTIDELAPEPASIVHICPKRIRVVIIANKLDVGGLERFIYDAAKGLNKDTFDVSIIVTGLDGYYGNLLRKSGIRVQMAEGGSSLFRRLTSEADVLWVHYALYETAYLSDLPVPILQTIHNSYVWLNASGRRSFKEFSENCTVNVCVSQNVARYTDLSLGVSPAKLRVIPNGVDTSGVAINSELVQTYGKRPIRILNVGSIYPIKAQLALVKAFHRMLEREKDKGIQLILVGNIADPDYATEIERYINQSGLSQNVSLAGFREDVDLWYNEADIFALPSVWEGWSLALNEALLHNLYVITTDVGSTQELLKERPDLGIVLPLDYGPIENVSYLNMDRIIEEHEKRIVPSLESALAKAVGLIRQGHYIKDHRGRRLMEQQYDFVTMMYRYEQLLLELYYRHAQPRGPAR